MKVTTQLGKFRELENSNDLLNVDFQGEETTLPSSDEIEKAEEMIKRTFALADAIPPRAEEEIWDSFEATRSRIALHYETPTGF